MLEVIGPFFCLSHPHGQCCSVASLCLGSTSSRVSFYPPKKLMSARLASFHILLFPSPGVTLSSINKAFGLHLGRSIVISTCRVNRHPSSMTAERCSLQILTLLPKTPDFRVVLRPRIRSACVIPT